MNKPSEIYYEKINKIRMLMKDGKQRTHLEIKEHIGLDVRTALYSMIDASEIEAVDRPGRNLSTYYVATRHLGLIIKKPNNQPTPAGVLLLQSIVMQQRALRFGAHQHG